MAGTVVRRLLAAAMLMASSALAAQPTETPQTPKPPAPGVSASLDSARAERGARMSVAIITYGPGEFVFEKFGHIALALTDSSTGQDIAFNWGMFDFSQPNFLGRFLTGDTKYWMEGYRTADFNAAYTRENRTIRKLELQLSAVQRGAIADFVRWNAQDANKYYRYDYYADNCATRVRDLLNWALQGQLDAPFAVPGSGRTWRNETARITASDPLVYPGIQVALGRNADHVLTKWEESFLPDLLANHLVALSVKDANGASMKLVTSDSVLYTADRAPMPEGAPSRVPMALVLGIVLAALVVLLSGAGSAIARFALVTFSVLWFGIGGVLGTALLLAGTVTKHMPYMGANLTVLQLHPLMLVAAVVITASLWRGARTRAATGVAALVALLSLVGLALQLVPSWHQQSGVVLAVIVPVQVAFAVATLRLRARSLRTAS
ncbi:DUF4105 domain-containing protein [Gemmatimonas groenlandica]|uniref:DUF4105 domain-containing protein n=1 Tax=Gemmatimonas groenlandica TaxID=2732249 RepID=A0A6M4IRS4_9BACT|nr:DUF4105 domain-containing protein [Gemmatimonas groenlandica]QJR35542.1 DUF4105 domain-containing protein [Gemmatimonas groenlandica]